ncbi:hypothetical protein ALI144C_05665 [Actinosynnema sp. ALI-1.44]|nr:hypothetical protein ALI144C_05665 [Actinosynnema sp. ALI-1.44]
MISAGAASAFGLEQPHSQLTSDLVGLDHAAVLPLADPRLISDSIGTVRAAVVRLICSASAKLSRAESVPPVGTSAAATRSV